MVSNLMKFIFSLLFAIIFIISYTALFTTSTGRVTTTSTTTVGATAFATGSANAVVTGFAPLMNITIKCSNSVETSAVLSEVSNQMAGLEANNSVSVFYPIRNNVSVESGSANTLQIYDYEYSHLNSSAVKCATFSTGEIVELPEQVTMMVQSQKVPVSLRNTSRNYTLPTTLSQTMNSIVHVKIAALLTQSGAVYGNLSVTESQV